MKSVDIGAAGVTHEKDAAQETVHFFVAIHIFSRSLGGKIIRRLVGALVDTIWGEITFGEELALIKEMTLTSKNLKLEKTVQGEINSNIRSS